MELQMRWQIKLSAYLREEQLFQRVDGDGDGHRDGQRHEHRQRNHQHRRRQRREARRGNHRLFPEVRRSLFLEVGPRGRRRRRAGLEGRGRRRVGGGSGGQGRCHWAVRLLATAAARGGVGKGEERGRRVIVVVDFLVGV